MRLGAHQSISGGFETAIRLAEEDGCEALQIFTKSSNQWRESVVTEDRARPFRRGVAGLGLGPVISHASYLVNLCSDDPAIRTKSIESLAAELSRCAVLGIPYLVLHPGSHRGQGEDIGVRQVAEGIDTAYASADAAGESPVRVLLETTAGQGRSVGHTFEHLAGIIERSLNGRRLAVCFDTCHVYAAGYDWTTARGYADVMGRLDGTVGLDRVLAFHLNDSRREAGSRIDRHEWIGDGAIGLEPFRRLLADERFASHPAVLEIPPRDDDRGYRENLRRLRGLLGAPPPAKPLGRRAGRAV